MFARLFALLPALGLLAPPARAAPVETEHYRIELPAGLPDAEQVPDVLEQAWSGFREFFKDKPDIPRNDRLVLRVFPDADAYRAAVPAEGASPVPGDGCYVPATKEGLLARQATPAQTRTLLLRVAARQYHYLARARNEDPVAAWYRDGVAEYLSWHHWDGEKLELGALPLVSVADRSGQAFDEIRRPDFDLEAVSAGEAPASPAVSWALFRYLTEGDAGKPLSSKYRRFVRKMDGGVKPVPLLWQSFAKPDELLVGLKNWLSKNLQPWLPHEGEWESLGPTTLRGSAKGTSVCRLRDPADVLKFTLEVPEGRVSWRAGVLLHYESAEDFAIAILNPVGQIRVARYERGRQRILAQGEGPPKSKDGNYRIEIFRKGEQVFLMFEGGLSYGPWDLPVNTLGLAIQGGEIRFRDLSWR